MDQYKLSVVDGRYAFSVAFPSADNQWGESHTVYAPAAANQWAHVAGVFDGWTIYLYINGVLAAQKTVQCASAPARALQASSRPVTIGNHPSWSAYDGDIDEVMLFPEALGASRIANLAITDFRTQGVILIDGRLYALLQDAVDAYRELAADRRGFRIGLMLSMASTTGHTAI